MEDSRKAEKRVLLVVDDEPLVGRMIRRVLASDFDWILTATDPEGASASLEEACVTHLICDCYLGPGLPRGCDLVAGWRRDRPSIRRAVIFATTDLSASPPPEGVDAVLHKSADADQIRKALEL
ncbi:MAG: hypothetical protein R6V85_08290 [Polyangia bacterium]